MARPRTFSEDEVLSKAMNSFWTHGFDAPLPVLLADMGLTRGSLYKAFGDKKSLFLRALDLYDCLYVTPGIEVLTDRTLPGLSRIERTLRAVIEDIEAGDLRGCLLCSTAAGNVSADADIAPRVQDMLDRLRLGFEVALEDTTEAERSGRASQLVATYVGLRILARAGASIDVLQASVASAARF